MSGNIFSYEVRMLSFGKVTGLSLLALLCCVQQAHACRPSLFYFFEEKFSLLPDPEVFKIISIIWISHIPAILIVWCFASLMRNIIVREICIVLLGLSYVEGNILLLYLVLG